MPSTRTSSVAGSRISRRLGIVPGLAAPEPNSIRSNLVRAYGRRLLDIMIIQSWICRGNFCRARDAEGYQWRCTRLVPAPERSPGRRNRLEIPDRERTAGNGL